MNSIDSNYTLIPPFSGALRWLRCTLSVVLVVLIDHPVRWPGVHFTFRVVTEIQRFVFWLRLDSRLRLERCRLRRRRKLRLGRPPGTLFSSIVKASLARPEWMGLPLLFLQSRLIIVTDGAAANSWRLYYDDDHYRPYAWDHHWRHGRCIELEEWSWYLSEFKF